MTPEFEISRGLPTARKEAETVITYCAEEDEWAIFTDYAPHARKYADVVVPSRNYPSRKVYHQETGDLITLEGTINGSVSVRGKREYTPAQREAMRKNLEAARAKQS